MSNPTKPLDQAFKDALSRAANLDQQGVTQDDTYDLFAGQPPSNVELVQACMDFYHANQNVMDNAVEGALDFLNSPHAVAQVKALEGSFDSPDLNRLSVELASEILTSGDFEFGLTKASAQPQALQGFGIGVSVGVSAILGALAGADVVFDFQDNSQVHGRTWAGLSAKGGLSISGGLELSFWVNKPLTGGIGGWLIDLYIVTELIFIRFMYIKQREQDSKELTFGGVSLQFPLGVGLPLRLMKEDNPLAVALFAARQNAFERSRRATLDIVNKATGVNTIAVEEVATLKVTLKNTSGNDVDLSAGATMTIEKMPAYFSEGDVGSMSIDYQGWTFTNDDGSKLTLTLSAAYTWKADAEISFDIINVKSSSTPPVDKQSWPGKITLTLADTSFSNPIAQAADFSLVWSNSEATLNWSVTLNAHDFTLEGDASGTTVAHAQPGTEIIQLTTAKSTTSDDVWILGYVYNYNTGVSEVTPQVYAAWWKQGSIKTGNNVSYGNKVSDSGKTICYYGGLSSTGSSIAIQVTFGASD